MFAKSGIDGHRFLTLNESKDSGLRRRILIDPNPIATFICSAAFAMFSLMMLHLSAHHVIELIIKGKESFFHKNSTAVSTSL